MQTSPARERSLADEKLVAALMNLSEPPIRENDAPFVWLAGHRVPLARIHAILGEEKVLQRLEERGIDLDWAFEPDLTRADLDEAGEWKEALEELGNRTWQMVEELYHQCLQKIEDDAKPMPEMAQKELLERLHRVLCGLGRTLEGTMSRAIRRSESPVLQLQWTNDDISCRWEQEEGSTEGFSLLQIVVSRTEELGDVPPSVAEVLPHVLMEALHEENIQIPAFRRARGTSPTLARLQWIKPILEERLAATEDLAGYGTRNLQSAADLRT